MVIAYSEICCTLVMGLNDCMDFLYLFLFCVVFIRFLFLSLFLLLRPVCRDLYTTCVCMLIVRPYVPLRQPENGQYRPKHVVVHYIVIEYTSCDTVVFDYIQFSKFHTSNGNDTLPRTKNLPRCH